jgi:branched-chain amino acid transport system substrate-binding protein
MKRLVAVMVSAIALSACGGSRLAHGDIVAAVNGGTLAGEAGQQSSDPTRPVSDSSASITGGAGSTSAPAGGAVVNGPTGGGATSGGRTAAAEAVAGARAGSATVAGQGAAGSHGPLAPIAVGNVGTFSGPIGGTTASAATMAQIWAQWTNAHGGIAGHPVQLFSADDGADPAKSSALVRDMVENKHVIAFIANMVPFTADASLAYLEQKHIPVIGGDMASAGWTQSPVMFPVGTTFLQIIEATLKSAHEANASKIGVLYCIEAATCDLQNRHINETAATYGDQVVYTGRISLTQPDFTAECLGAQQAGAQAIWVGAESNTAERIAASCTRQNYHPIYMTDSVAVTTREAQVPAFEGFLAPSATFPWVVTGGTPEIDAYSQSIQQYAPGLERSGATAITWASGELLRKVAAGMGAQPSSDVIFDGLWALRGETVGGLTPPLTFAAHQPTPPITCYFLMRINGGRWTAPYGAEHRCL